jgi:hypothetical protein
VAQAQQLTGATFNLVICDEAHRLTGKTDADYATVLDNSKIVADKRLFMTATPRTYTPAAKSKAEDRGVEITSMDDETVYGPVLHKLSFGEAIKQDLLSDYRVLIVGVTDPQVQDLIDRRELVSVNDTVTTDARTLAAHIGLAKATKDYNLKRTISFHSRIKSADQFAQDHIKILDWLPDTHKPEGNTWTGTISGAMNTGERRRLLTQLKQDDQDRHALLTNARCLTEGVDVPSLDGVAFIDPRSSQVDIIQAVGRAIRKSANKEIGTIVLPVLIPTDADAEHALEDTAFKPIWAILNALKSHDEELAVELNTLRTELGRTGSVGRLPDRLVEDLAADIDWLLPGFANMLGIAIVEHTTDSWSFFFELLLAYTEENSSRMPINHEVYQGHNLGNWVSAQRGLKKNCKLSKTKESQLNAIENWSWTPLDSQFEVQFINLKIYTQQHGTSLVPQSFTDHGLGRWVSKQRGFFRKGKLKPERVILFESLPGWAWEPKEEIKDEFVIAMTAFSEREGHCNVPQQHMENGIPLGRRVANRRNEYKHKKLSADLVEYLESLPGWSWKLKTGPRRNLINEQSGKINIDDQKWMENFEALKTYINREQSIEVEREHIEGGLKIGLWVNNQRVLKRRGKLPDHYKGLLETIPGWDWDPGRHKFNDWYILLKRFVDREGHSRVPQSHKEEGRPLGSWITKIRSDKRSSLLLMEEISLLEALPYWVWDPPPGKKFKLSRDDRG